MLFNCIGLLHTGSEQDKLSASTLFKDLVTFASHEKLLSPSRVKASRTSNEALWMEWAHDEARRRTGYCIWVYTPPLPVTNFQLISLAPSSWTAHSHIVSKTDRFCLLTMGKPHYLLTRSSGRLVLPMSGSSCGTIQPVLFVSSNRSCRYTDALSKRNIIRYGAHLIHRKEARFRHRRIQPHPPHPRPLSPHVGSW